MCCILWNCKQRTSTFQIYYSKNSISSTFDHFPWTPQLFTVDTKTASNLVPWQTVPGGHIESSWQPMVALETWKTCVGLVLKPQRCARLPSSWGILYHKKVGNLHRTSKLGNSHPSKLIYLIILNTFFKLGWVPVFWTWTTTRFVTTRMNWGITWKQTISSI